MTKYLYKAATNPPVQACLDVPPSEDVYAVTELRLSIVRDANREFETGDEEISSVDCVTFVDGR